MLNVVILAVASAIAPTIVAVVIVVLRTPRPKRLLGAYLFGGMLTSIAIGIALVSSLNELNLVSGSSPAADPALNFTVGALALLVAFVLATDRDAPLEARRQRRREKRPARDPWSERMMQRGTAPVAFAVGLALNLPGAFYLVALKDIAQGQVGTGAQVFAIVVFNVIMFALAEVPLIGYALAPEKTQAKVEALNDWMSGHARQLVIAIAILAGAYLIGRGIAGVL